AAGVSTRPPAALVRASPRSASRCYAGARIRRVPMDPARRADATQILVRARRGEQQALADLLPLVYGELRELAARYLRRERAGHTLQPTALVNEALLRLVDSEKLGE